MLSHVENKCTAKGKYPHINAFSDGEATESRYTGCLKFNVKKNETSDRQRDSKTKMWNEHWV